MEFKVYKLPEVAELLGIKDYQIYYFLRHRKIPRPIRDHSGDYIFMQEDVERIRELLEMKVEFADK